MASRGLPAGGRVGLLACLLAAWPCAGGAEEPQTAEPPAAGPTAERRYVLESGAVVLLLPIPGAPGVALESFHDVGFLDEPAGGTQLSHLVEHLVCKGATRSYPAGKAWAEWSGQGLLNAETLADFTHYDLAGPADRLLKMVDLEQERLTTLSITPELVREEALRCYEEAKFVEQGAPFKHAFMAAAQAWRHGRRSASVRGGLEKIPLTEIQRFHQESYGPKGLILSVVGAFEPGDALKALRERFGRIPAVPPSEKKVLDLAKLSGRRKVQWDLSPSCVVVACPPPGDRFERVILSLWSSLLLQKHWGKREMEDLVSSILSTNVTWPAGKLPWFLGGVVAKGKDLAEVEERLQAILDAELKSSASQADIDQMRADLTQLARGPTPSAIQIDLQARSLAAYQKMDIARAKLMVLGNVALQAAMAERLLGGDREAIFSRIGELTPEELQGVLRRNLAPARRFATWIEPAPASGRP